MFRHSRVSAATVVALLWMSSWSPAADAGSIAGNAVPEGPAALWQQEAQLRASDGTGDDRLGFSVAFSGDTVVIGALGDDIADNDDQGAAYVFVRSGGVWTEQAKLTASDGAESDHFGWSVGISGDTVVVGAPDATVDGNFSQGAAYVFTRDGGVWTEQAKLTASNGAGSDDFGRAVGVSGDTALVGAYFHEVNDNFRQGAAYVFTRDAGAWSEQAILTASDGEANTRFGSAVAIEGDTALATAPTSNVGDNSLQGAAYVFTRIGDAWNEQGKLTAADGAAFDQFGSSAAVSGDTAVVGAAFAGVDGNFQQGAAYVFSRSAGVWSEQGKLTASDGEASDVFGDSVSVSADMALIGAPGPNAAYLFTRSGETWSEGPKLVPAGGQPGDFGNGVALSGMTSVVGAPFTGFVTEASQGAAYAFFDVPPDFGTLQGSIQSLGYCDSAVIPLAGATLTITGAQGTYTPMTDGAGTYQVFLAADESPLDITVTAPGHVPVTTEDVTLGAGETVTVDFDVPFDAPCPTVDPAGLAVELLPDEVVTETVTLGNVGTADFDWEVFTDAPDAQGLRLPTGATTPVTVSRPRPLTGNGEWGASDGEGRLRVDPATELFGGPLTITHSESLDVVAGTTMICRAGDGSTPEQSFLRTFTLADFGISDDFGITGVAFGIESLSTPATIDVNLYTLEGELVFDNLTLIGSTSVSLSPQQLSFVEVPVSATTPAGATLVVEIRAPDLFLIGGFFPGSNSAGETAHSYVSAVACGNPEPVTFSSLGFPDVHLVMAVSGGSADCGAPWLSVVPGSGTVAPDGSQQVDVTLDSTGLFPVPGEYHSRICLDTNDAQRPEIFVPVDLSVTVPPDFATLEGTVEGLGHCGAAPGTVDGASVVVTSQVDSYTLSPDEAGFYRLGLDPAEGPVDITVSAPGHTPQTVSGVTLTAGETALHDFSLVLEQPCATVTPQEHTSELPPDSGEVVELTLGNIDGGAALNWSIATAEPPAIAGPGTTGSGEASARGSRTGRSAIADGTSDGGSDLVSTLGLAVPGPRPGHAAGGGIDCDAEPGLIVHDDGTIENAYSGSVATGVVDVRFADRFTPSFHPASLRAVCLVFATVEGGPDSLDFEIVVYDDDGPDGGPGTVLGSLPATATGIPEFPVDVPVWASFDISSLDITVATGSVYVGARWTPSDPNVWLAADESPENPVGFAEGFWWNDNDGVWAPIENEFEDYRSMFVRAAVAGEVDCDNPTAVSWLSVDPASGSIAAGESGNVEVSLDTTGLAPGTYEAGLCVTTDDPVKPLVAVPVTLSVVAGGPGPEQIKISATDGMNGDLFGRSIDIDGDTAVISADNADVDGVSNQGAAYVFVRDGETWVEQAKLIASDGAQFDQFGFSVAVSGDTALIGSAADAAYVFTRDGTTWTERVKLLPSDPTPDDNFGIAVALQGDTALIGARQADVDGNFNQGAAYVFVGSGDAWSEQAKLTATDGMAFDVFGDAVALSGDTAVVGAAFADPDGNDAQGAAWVFVRNGETWSEQAKLLASDGVSGDWLGSSVAVDGDTAVIGAEQATVDGNTFQGAAYVFTRDGGTWSEQTKLVADDGAQGDAFGESAALANGVALVGALFADDAQGTAYVFTQDGASWSQELELTADDGAPADQFGKSVALDGATAAVGAWTATVEGNANQGTAYMFELAGIGPAVIPVDDGVVEVAADGQCSLIEAFENAVDGGATHADCEPGSPAGSTIVLAPGSLYTLTAMHNDSEGPNGLPTVTGRIAVEGNGATIERSGAAPPFRPLHVGAAGELSLADLTVRGGSLGAPNLSGAGVRNDGTLSVSDSTLSNNSGAGSGGAIYNAAGATLHVSRSTLQNNGGGGAGSGIHNAGGGTATVTHSTLNGNNCGGGGCGIHNEGELAVENSTLSSNGGPFGGGINNLGTMTLSHVTLAANGGAQGGLLNGGTATLRNTLVANVPSAENDCAGAPPTFEGVNMIGDGSCGCTEPTCLTGDPMLEPLGDNGGPTQTHALPDGSIAIDKGGDDVCLGDDQRGVARPLDGEGDGSADDLDGGCDIGAYEAPPAPAPALAFDPTSLAFGDVVVGTPSTPMTATLSNTGDADATGLVFSTPGNGFQADTTDCGFFLAPGDSCDVVVTFTPPVVGPASAELQADALEGATALLALAGNGVESPAPELGFAPSGLDFGDVDVDTTSEPQSITLANTGDGDATGLTFEPLGGGFEADTTDCGTTLAAGTSCVINVTFSPAEPGEATATLQVGSSEGATASAGLSGNGVGDEGFTPVDLEVDPAGLTPEANGLFEPGETVDVAPAWRNDGELAASLAGTASDFTGPEGAAYSIDLDAADYGLIEPDDTASCLDTEVCYRLGLDDPAARPAEHWDATFDETLDDTDGTTKTWTLHIGASFDDVPTANPFYPAIETLLHSGVTGGCATGAEAAGLRPGRGRDMTAGADGRHGGRPLQGGAAYCPGGANSRAQMPVFMLRALMGADYTPPACDEGNDPFGDVPFDSVFCPWIQDLAGRGIVSGCGDGDYCPGNPVSRAQMAIFLLKTLEGADYVPPECTEQFTDVPCPSLFADWIEDLAAREITSGCSETEYCPGNPVSRAQMAVFITRTFGLTLYGP